MGKIHQSRSSFGFASCFAIALSFGGLSTACEGPVPGLQELNGEVQGQIVGGNEVDQCGFPTTVSLGGCTGTLIHPQVILTAAHCGNPTVATFTERFQQGFQRNISCQAVPQNIPGQGDDTMFCVMNEPVNNIPITPVLMGCELGALDVGTDVAIVGFGLTSFQNQGSGDRKRWTTTEIVGFESGVSLIGTSERSACPGDSGGPAFVRLADGGWRVFGNVSGGTTGIPCNGRGAYPHTFQHVPWFEANFGIDISPCHDADGTWNPGPNCGEFFAGSSVGSGSYSNGCAGTPTTGRSDTCGAAFSSATPDLSDADDTCDVVPEQYVGVNDGCDCPADGSISCDPDCQLGNGGARSCGCDYCY